MFGQRSMGRPLARRPVPGQTMQQDDAGTLQGNERFLRTNRRASDFVGPDIRELQRFIGSIQARSPAALPPATTDVRRRIDRSTSVNQPLKPAGNDEIGLPQLVFDFGRPSVIESDLQRELAGTLERCPQLADSSRIEVSVAGRIATLRGEVASDADRDLVALLVSFEPGVSTIRNALEVVPARSGQTARSGQSDRRSQEPVEPAWITLSHGSTRPAAKTRTSPKTRPAIPGPAEKRPTKTAPPARSPNPR